ncbi:site-specific integrase [Rhizobium sp. BK251]|uniref:tyrosine-type recombinase/integrase n=1 Tax=Rhizobium sp. BK251 TaxID=2512125 RepID=UPI001043905A|nr:site-specific integrase [Rhizobium sp. BK251]TCL74457.1 site-specific recombinase XerD [Rhizobium sp. BK251]
MRKPTNLLTPEYIRSLTGTRCQKVDAERNDLSIVMPAMTWQMRNAEGKRVKIPGPVHNAAKYDREAALRAIDKLTRPPEAELEPLPAPDGVITLGYAMAAWKQRRFAMSKAKKLRDSSKDTYGYWLKHIENWTIEGRPATSKPLDDITPVDVDDLQEELSDRSTTANKVIFVILSAVYKFAKGKRWTVYNPTEGLERLPTDPFQPILSKAEFAQLYEAAWRVSNSDPAAWPLLLICNTGSRTAEAANIPISEIDGNKWAIAATRAKAKKAHVYALESSQQVFIARRAAGWKTDVDKTNAVRHLYQKLLKQLGIPKSGVHAIRRHIASVIAEKYGIEAASAHLGHASVTQTAQYVKVWKEKRQEVAEDIATMLFRAAEVG